MAQKKRHSSESVDELLRQIKAGVADGKTMAKLCKDFDISVRTYYRWSKAHKALEVSLPPNIKKLEQENANLKRLVAELTLQKLALRDMIASDATGPFNWTRHSTSGDPAPQTSVSSHPNFAARGGLS
jgi:transposase-like protein